MQPATVKGSQLLQPLFEFSGACAGCGETPYLKLLTPALRRPRCSIANATGCSSIYGGNLPTTPWTTNADGRGPGVVELAVRGQRRVRPRHAAGARPAARRRRGELLARADRRRSATSSSTALLERRPGRPRPGSRAARARGRAEASSSPRSTTRGAKRLADARRRARPQERVDRRRRRLGVRHRLRRAGPRARRRAQTSTSSCSTPRSTRTPAARRRRRRRAARWRSSPPAARHAGKKDLGHDRRWPTATSTSRRSRSGANDAADGEGVRRGRGLPRPVAHHRLQPLHRARHRHGARRWPTRRRRSTPATGRSTATTRGSTIRSSSTRARRSCRSAEFTGKENRFLLTARSNPAEAAELAAEEQHDVEERWRLYERLSHVGEHGAPAEEQVSRSEAPSSLCGMRETEELGRGGRLRGGAAGELVAAAYAAESAHGPRLARGLSLADLAHAVALVEGGDLSGEDATALLRGLLELARDSRRRVPVGPLARRRVQRARGRARAAGRPLGGRLAERGPAAPGGVPRRRSG